jgi:prepilin signal peptidase PulO-like enzyme (type II secretory pathway)
LQNWGTLGDIGLPFAPFAIAVYLSKGKGLGWDDAKLAALGGAILGLEAALIAFATAGIAGVAVAWARKRTREPIPFGAYMIATIALSLLANFKA